MRRQCAVTGGKGPWQCGELLALAGAQFWRAKATLPPVTEVPTVAGDDDDFFFSDDDDGLFPTLFPPSQTTAAEETTTEGPTTEEQTTDKQAPLGPLAIQNI